MSIDGPSEPVRRGARTASLLYDPLKKTLRRLVRVHDGNTANARWFVYDGGALVAEFDGNGTMLKRYMHGPGVDEPLAWFDGSSTAVANRHDMFANAQGSIIVITNSSGVKEAINRYDEFGIPQSNTGRFGFTGQAWIPEVGLSYYKARMYSPSLGRFMQTDPIGYDDGPNWYNYVGGDPANRSDPTGLLKSPLEWLNEKRDKGNNSTTSGGMGKGGSEGDSESGQITVTGILGEASRLFRDQLSFDFAFDMIGGQIDFATGNGAFEPSDPDRPCDQSASEISSLANAADRLATSAGYGAVAAQFVAIGSAPTIIGPITFKLVSGGLAFVSLGATGVSTYLRYSAGNNRAGFVNGASTVAGLAVGAFLTSRGIPATQFNVAFARAADQTAATGAQALACRSKK